MDGVQNKNSIFYSTEGLKYKNKICIQKPYVGLEVKTLKLDIGSNQMTCFL